MEKQTEIVMENTVKTDTPDINVEAILAENEQLKETLKSKSIEARLAKKETKEAPAKPDNDTLARLERMELKDLGLKDDSEIELIRKEAAELGVDPVKFTRRGLATSILDNHRKEIAAQEAMPSGNGKAAASQRDSVDYWIAKGELPPNTSENVELRSKVVRKKREISQRAKMFNYEI